MRLEDLQSHIDNRLDRIEDKLDDHIQRISRTEESIIWIKGHLKISVSLFITAFTAMAATLYKYLQ